MSQRRREIARAPKGRQNHLVSRDFCRSFGAKIIGFHLLVDPRADALGYGLTPPPGAQEPFPDSLSADRRPGPGLEVFLEPLEGLGGLLADRLEGRGIEAAGLE